MKLTSMKMSPKQAKEMSEPAIASKGPEYPYGLQLRMDEDCLAKLDMKKLPKVGGSIILTAKCKVRSTEQDDTPKGKRRSMELQITDLAFTPEKGDVEDVFYPEE